MLSPNVRFAALATAAAIALTGCSDDATNAELVAGTQGAPIALGLTLHQLTDADLIGAGGMELAEVERVIKDNTGQVTGLVVEIEDSEPDRFVQIPLDRLTSVRTGDDWVLQGNVTREELAALPAVKL